MNSRVLLGNRFRNAHAPLRYDYYTPPSVHQRDKTGDYIIIFKNTNKSQ